MTGWIATPELRWIFRTIPEQPTSKETVLQQRYRWISDFLTEPEPEYEWRDVPVKVES